MAAYSEEEDETVTLPEFVDLHDFSLSWRVYLLMDMFGWTRLPSEILAEDEQLLDDLVTIKSISGVIEKMQRSKDNNRIL